MIHNHISHSASLGVRQCKQQVNMGSYLTLALSHWLKEVEKLVPHFTSMVFCLYQINSSITTHQR